MYNDNLHAIDKVVIIRICIGFTSCMLGFSVKNSVKNALNATALSYFMNWTFHSVGVINLFEKNWSCAN